MASKYFPKWLTGGIIGGIVAIILYEFYLFGIKIAYSSLSNPYPNVPEFIKWFSWKLFFLFSFGFGTGKTYLLSKLIILLVVCFIIGALIGLIIANRKSKK